MLDKTKQTIRQNPLLFSIVRFARYLRRIVYYLARAKKIRCYFDAHEVHKLHIGAGPNILPGWLNTDISLHKHTVVSLDARKKFSFGDGTFHCVFSEHQFEQLSHPDGLKMLQECHRILKPGGKIRIATPSLETLIGLNTQTKSAIQERYVRWYIDQFLPGTSSYRDSFVINSALRNWGHTFLYDRPTLESSLLRAGFVDCTWHAPGESESESLRGIESHGIAVGNEEMNQFETMVIEAYRPINSDDQLN